MSQFSNWTLADVNAHNARVTGVTGVTQQSPAVDREADLHNDILEACRGKGWIALHGSMACPSARTLGEWDFVILAERRVLLVECKSRTGKLTREQAGLHYWAAKLGHTTHIVRSIEELWTIANRDA